MSKRTLLLTLCLMWLYSPAHAAEPNDRPEHVRSVAARCAGEATGAVQLCACTVRNRHIAGWPWHKVLTAYYAPDRTPTADQLQQAADGLAGVDCTGTEYYLYSATDIADIGLRQSCAVASASGVFAFPREALNTCR
jgi:hypothetical protein